MTRSLPITIDDVRRAAGRIAGVAHRTPVLTSRYLDKVAGANLFLKAEHLQRVGAFKFRGAYNAIAALEAPVRARGVVAFSSGNHAQAVALSSALLGVEATIVMPSDAPKVKLDATRGYGAEVVLYDRYAEDRPKVAARLVQERGATLIPPFDHLDIMAGQGTAALELLEEVPDLDVLVTPVGGGGLLSGCAVAARGLNPNIRLVGVEPAGRRAARDAMDRGEVVEVAVVRTMLDGQQTTDVGQRPLEVFLALVDEVVGVTDDEVADTVRTLALRTKQVVEPSGASAVAAVVAGHIAVAGRRVGIVVSGGNVAPDVIARLLADA